MKKLPHAFVMVVLSPVVAIAQTNSSGLIAPPFPSDQLIGFIQNNPQAFDSEYKRKLFEGYKKVFWETSEKSLKPFVFEGEWTKVPNTNSPVRTDNPSCLRSSQNPEPTRDEDVQKLLTALAAVSILSLEGAPVVSLVGAVMAIGVAAFSEKRQDYGACALTCTMIPGEISSTDIEKYGRVTLSHITPPEMTYSGSFEVGDPKGTLSNLGWAAWETPLYSVTKVPENQLPIKVPINHPAQPKDLEGKCPATLVCGRFKNWSHTWPRQSKISVRLDAGPWLENGCYDTSIIDSKLKSEFLKPALKQQDMDVSDLLKKYYDALPKR